MFLAIQKHTNWKVSYVRSEIRKDRVRIYPYMIPFTMDVVKACLGLILYAGADCHNFTAVDDL